MRHVVIVSLEKNNMNIGVDITSRKRYVGKEEQIAKKILSEKEYQIYQSSADKIHFLMGRFAAKEAFLKANGKGLFEIDFKEIRIINDQNGMPHLIYRGQEDFDVSISHDEDYAIAMVVRR